MSEHTPGPWVIAGLGAIVPADRNGTICVFAAPFPIGANTRLIAAAPDLLAALTEVALYLDPSDSFAFGPLQQARAAIAKATGKEP